jgi:SNF2-related domain
MVTSPEAIERFLKHKFTLEPSLKGRSEKELINRIRKATGTAPVFLTEPRPHQLEGLTYALEQKRALLYFGMRLGKTKITLDWASQLRRCGLWRGTGLIIAHAPVGLDVWVSEARKHSKLSIKAIHLSVDELIETIANPPDLIVMTWSGMQQMFCEMRTVKRGKRKGETKLYPDLEIIRLVASAFDLVAIDEIHVCNNWDTLHYKMAVELVHHCNFRLGLTGTPFGRNPYSLWAQFRLIDGGVALSASFPFFKEAFGREKLEWFSKRRNKEGKGYVIVFDEKKTDILTHKLSSCSMAYSRAEVADDEIEAGIVQLRMRGAQRKAYLDYIDKIIDQNEIDEEVTKSSYHRLRQISSGYLPYTDATGKEKIVHFESAKLDWLSDFLDEVEDAPVLIFHEYIETGRIICEFLKKRKKSLVWIRGDGKDKTGLVKAFQSGDAQFCVANATSGGISIDLNRADYMVYFESPVSTITRAQSEARPLAERNGRLLSMDDLVASPVEAKILDYLHQGRNLMNEVITKQSLAALRKL